MSWGHVNSRRDQKQTKATVLHRTNTRRYEWRATVFKDRRDDG